MKVLLINPGESPRVVSIDGSLKSMQNLVGGFIQAIYPFADPVAIVCNDEAKLLGMEPNCALRHPETGEVYDIVIYSFAALAAPNKIIICSDSKDPIYQPTIVYAFM